MIFSSLFSPSFWFQATPPMFISSIDRASLVLFVMMIAGGVWSAWQYTKLRQDKLMRRWHTQLATLLISAGSVGLLLYGFLFERIPYLSMRIWWVAWFVWVAWAGWNLYQRFRVHIPAMKHARAERERFTKWLPKRK